ncbi:glutamine-hydrolyzing GMP synthase [Blochmannia endosymbiont of Polyrhachis (Hedomyrma) turneri]|uniref:glutamine-hydrolyzing GMP synthase n=1 Tax=Blochmannia endosymbiont of Polyrhachis (Hedomyrma) turneri TaxID=1505596 RepID=UPI00061A5991|nr:glutamine-hydrolyzing GMP synthase [Blochmannia endosymbiont of Polyrhachis (Hedomyrma) turneri]AKC60086.1 GMP synthase [glutamine-hydrolyzing] [Blochmannia endosymbiont of Polyrhachis (Hedomyrma) turneri]
MNFINKSVIKDFSVCKSRILILDFCSQYTQLIARRVRELGVYCEVFFCWNLTEHAVRQFTPSGIILSGSPMSVYAKNVINNIVPEYIFKFNVPILGICYGMHVLVAHFGGVVRKSISKREFGYSQLEVVVNSVLVQGIYDSVNVDGRGVLDVWMSHADTVISIPDGFVVIAVTKSCDIAIIANEKQRLYGLQFHPEVTHTRKGKHILKRFIFQICSCQSLWNSKNIINYLITDIRNTVRSESVLLAFSGGIDSLVTALLLRRAIGDSKLICYFVDTGLLRYNDCTHIKRLMQEYSLNIIYISAANRFFDALVGISNSEEKRKVIGRVFIEVFEGERKKLANNNVKWLAQGTIYPDIIESGISSSVVANEKFFIKSHHNVGGLPDIKSMALLEPIKHLFKDEVRTLGKELGVSSDILCDHPFPGPGLGIRILGEVNRERCDLLRCADLIFIEELKMSNLYTKISQAFVVFLPVRSVGVMGDVRKYEWVVALRAVETVDFMTARWAEFPYDFLCKVSTRIINEVDGISRVVYDISNKPPSTIEWE